MAKKKKKNKALKSGSEADVNTTHGLVTMAINMQLAQHIKEAKESDGCPTMIDPKSIELGIKWCAHNKVSFREESTEELRENVTELDNIRNQQRGRILHAVNED